MVFKQLMQLLTASPFSYLHMTFNLVTISEDQWSGEVEERSRVKIGLGMASAEPFKSLGSGKCTENIVTETQEQAKALG